MGKQRNKFRAEDQSISDKSFLARRPIKFEITVDFSDFYEEMNGLPDDGYVIDIAFEKQKNLKDNPILFSKSHFADAYKAVKHDLELKEIRNVTFIIVDGRLTTTYKEKKLQQYLMEDYITDANRGVLIYEERRVGKGKIFGGETGAYTSFGFTEPIIFEKEFVEFNSPKFAEEIIKNAGFFSAEEIIKEIENSDYNALLFSDISSRSYDVVSNAVVFSEKLKFAKYAIALIKDFANINSIDEKKKTYDSFKHIHKKILSKIDILTATAETIYDLSFFSIEVLGKSKALKATYGAELKIITEKLKKIDKVATPIIEGLNIIKYTINILEGKNIYQNIADIGISIGKIMLAREIISGVTFAFYISWYYLYRLGEFTVLEIAKIPSIFVSNIYFTTLKIIDQNFKKVTSAYLVSTYIFDFLFKNIGFPKSWGEEHKEIYARKLNVLYFEIKSFERKIPKNELYSELFLDRSDILYREQFGNIKLPLKNYSFLDDDTLWPDYQRWLNEYYTAYYIAIVKLYVKSAEFIKMETKRVLSKRLIIELKTI